MAKALSCSLEEPEFHPRTHGQCLKDHPQESTSREKQSLTRLKWAPRGEQEKRVLAQR